MSEAKTPHAREKTGPRRKGQIVALLLILLAAGALAMNWGSLRHALTDYRFRKDAYVLRVGAGDAKVVIDTYMFFQQLGPEALQLQTLEKLLKRYPEDVAVRYIDIGHERGFGLWKASPFWCPGVVVNGQKSFQYEDSGEIKTMMFRGTIQTPEEAHGLECVVRQELTNPLPKPKIVDGEECGCSAGECSCQESQAQP